MESEGLYHGSTRAPDAIRAGAVAKPQTLRDRAMYTLEQANRLKGLLLAIEDCSLRSVPQAVTLGAKDVDHAPMQHNLEIILDTLGNVLTECVGMAQRVDNNL